MSEFSGVSLTTLRVRVLLRAGENETSPSLHFAFDRNKIVATPIEVKGNGVSIGTPAPLFDTSFAVAADLASDSRLLLAMSPNSHQSEGITVVTNWPATLRK